MLEIIKQCDETDLGNDCLIHNCYVILKCHDKYVVMNIRKYTGWCDDGHLDIRGRREYDSIESATIYYNNELRYM